ncbi:MAG TPA: hypothetical protein VFB62_18615, partial [Polyangiaceae bacterium]|nr:hypothetical protein [Polyangiaceae bacterium]
MRALLPLLLSATACTSLLGDDFEIVVPAEHAEESSTVAHGSGGSGGGGSTVGAGSGGTVGEPAPLKPGAIATGGYHSCVLRESGGARCWGRNDSGQLGAGSVSVASGPVSTTGTATFTAITAGTNFTCGLTPAGSVACWGANAHGQLGTGSLIEAHGPLSEVVGLSAVKEINAVSYSVCALKDNGSVWCWGDDVDNTLGDDINPPTCESENYVDPIVCPVMFPQQSEVTSATRLGRGLPRSNFTGGANRSCVLRGDDAIWCWGPGSPVEEQSLLSVAALGTGAGFSCALSSDGTVSCFGGTNAYGQLGNGTTAPVGGITKVSLPPAVMLAAARYTACAVLEDRSV